MEVAMQALKETIDNAKYASCVTVSKRVRWDIDRDVICGRELDFSKKFLPEGLSLVGALPMLNAADRRLLSQIQGRTYANMFALVERFVGPKILEVSRDHWLGDPMALEALVRFTDEELKHQELFRRIERLCAAGMPSGYAFLPQADDVANFVLGKSTWAVLALICMIEIVTQVHYRQSIAPDADASQLWKDVFLFHWKEESQHAILDELEWIREDSKLDHDSRDRAVTDLIELAAGVDGIVQTQAAADAEYFLNLRSPGFSAAESDAIRASVLKAYRWQYIVSGVREQRFGNALARKITPAQGERIAAALAPIM
jgi:hypothetical protein